MRINDKYLTVLLSWLLLGKIFLNLTVRKIPTSKISEFVYMFKSFLSCKINLRVEKMIVVQS